MLLPRVIHCYCFYLESVIVSAVTLSQFQTWWIRVCNWPNLVVTQVTALSASLCLEDVTVLHNVWRRTEEKLSWSKAKKASICYICFSYGDIWINVGSEVDHCLLSSCLWHVIPHQSRFQWPRGLRRRSAAAHLLRLWARIPPGAYMFIVSVVWCQVAVSVMSWSLVQRSPTDCGASLCVI